MSLTLDNKYKLCNLVYFLQNVSCQGNEILKINDGGNKTFYFYEHCLAKKKISTN